MHRRHMVMLLVCLMILTGCKRDENQLTRLQEAESIEENQETKETADSIFVYVCGAVEQEGVYELSLGSRVYEAIQMAGGFSETAAVSQINQAEILEDEMKIYVPTIDEAATMQEEEDGKTNLNTASKEELMKLSGVGEAKAQAILQYREEHGRFQSVEEIMNIPGIKQGLFEKIKHDIKI